VANNSLSSIRSALSSALSGVSKLQQVVNGRSIDMTGFPYCRFYYSGYAQTQQDNRPSYWRTYTFTVEVWQEITNKAKADAEADFEDAVQAVIDALQLGTAWQLSGNADDTQITPSPVELREGPQGPCVVQALRLAVKTLVS
jgi:Fe-S-cluster containining protein